jgi:hypothetical protein
MKRCDTVLKIIKMQRSKMKIIGHLMILLLCAYQGQTQSVAQEPSAQSGPHKLFYEIPDQRISDVNIKITEPFEISILDVDWEKRLVDGHPRPLDIFYTLLLIPEWKDDLGINGASIELHRLSYRMRTEPNLIVGKVKEGTDTFFRAEEHLQIDEDVAFSVDSERYFLAHYTYSIKPIAPRVEQKDYVLLKMVNSEWFITSPSNESVLVQRLYNFFLSIDYRVYNRFIKKADFNAPPLSRDDPAFDNYLNNLLKIKPLNAIQPKKTAGFNFKIARINWTRLLDLYEVHQRGTDDLFWQMLLKS